jgi:hypothetical protein
VLAACADQACSAADACPVLFKRPLDLHQTTFAMGEAVAHLHRLWHQGQLTRSLAPTASGASGFSRSTPESVQIAPKRHAVA